MLHFLFTHPATTEIYTLSLHDALPISLQQSEVALREFRKRNRVIIASPDLQLQEQRSEEHTSELQSHHDLVCRLLLEKKQIRSQLLATTSTLVKAVTASLTR